MGRARSRNAVGLLGAIITIVCFGLFQENALRRWSWRVRWTYGDPNPPPELRHLVPPRRSPKRPPLDARPRPPRVAASASRAEGPGWLRLGLAGLATLVAFALLTGGTAVPVFARPPVFDVKDFGAVGDGVFDDTPKIQAALNASRDAVRGVVLLSRCSVGYRIIPNSTVNGATVGGLLIYSNTTLKGHGAASPLLLLATDFTPTTSKYFVRNADETNGNNNVTVKSVYFQGPVVGGLLRQDANTVALAVRCSSGVTTGPTGHCRAIKTIDCDFTTWPGPTVQYVNTINFRIKDSTVDTPMGGGFVVWYDSYDGEINDNTVIDGHDDCIALNSRSGGTGAGAVFPHDITIDGNELSELPYASTGDFLGSPVFLRGAQSITISDNVLVGGDDSTAKGGISIYNEGVMPATGITIDGNRIRDAGGCGIFVVAGDEGGVPGSTARAFTVAAATDVFTSTAHGYANGSRVRLASVTAAAPLALGVTYYVVNATANTFQLSLVAGGAAIDITSDGSGAVAGTARDIQITDNTIARAQSIGIRVGTNTLAAWMNDVTIDDNRILDCGVNDLTDSGINIYGQTGQTGPIDGLWIDNNKIVNAFGWAIRTDATTIIRTASINDNKIKNPHPTGATAGRDAIFLLGPISNFDIHRNQVVNENAPTQVRYAINVPGSACNGRISGNVGRVSQFSGVSGLFVTASNQTFTVAAATDVFTLVGHGRVNGDPVTLTAVTAAAPLALGVTYYVVGATNDTFQLSATSGGAAINVTVDGSGTLDQNIEVFTDNWFDRPTQTIAAAATLLLRDGTADGAELHSISGATGITDLDAGARRRQLTLAFTGAPLVTSGNRLKLKANFQAAAGSTLVLYWDGVTATEQSRVPDNYTVQTITDANPATPSWAFNMGELLTLSQDTLFNAPSGTPLDGQVLVLRIKSAAPHVLSWDVAYRGSVTVPIPVSSSGGGKTDYIYLKYDLADGKIDFVSVDLGH